MSDNIRDIESYSCTVLHPEAVEKAKSALLDESRLAALAEFFRLFADPTRLSILASLAVTELCVCDLSETLGMSQSAISHQLAGLRRARLVKARRDGKSMYYSLDDDHVHKLLAIALEHLTEEGRA